MRLTILCGERDHPIFPHLESWEKKWKSIHKVKLETDSTKIDGGDLLFLISFPRIVGDEITKRFRHTLVVHASDLPEGRGWSPHIWQIVEGRSTITVSLLEAAAKVDSGAIWSKRKITLEGHELFDEINEKLFSTTIELMDFAVDNMATIQPQPQSDVPISHYRKRTPADSALDPNRSFAEQFDLMRVADPNRFPNFFDYRGKRYHVFLRKAEQE